MANTIAQQVDEQEKARKTKIYEDNSTSAERAIYGKLKKILEHFRDNIFPGYFDIVKSKLLYNKEYEQELKKHNMRYKSAKIYPLILSVHDTFMASLYDNDLRPKVFPIEDVEPRIIDEAEKFFQRGTEISETEQTQEIIRNEASLIGASYGMPGYTTSSMKNDDGEKQTIFIPMLFPVSIFEMFYSVGATDFYKAPEKFRRRFIPFDQLQDVFFPIWEGKDGMGKQVEKKKTAILEAPMPLSKADYTKIYDIDAYSRTYISCLGDADPTGLVYDETFNVLDSSSYCEVIDLYIGNQMMVLVNGYTVYSGQSVFSYGSDYLSNKEGPFIELTYEKGKGSVPQGLGQKLMGHQRQCNALYNSISDAMYRHLNPVLAVVQGAITDPTTGNSPTTLDYIEGKAYSINPSYAGMSNVISKLDWTDYNILNLAINYFESVKQDAFTIAGVNSYVLGGEGKVERSRYGAEQKVAASKARLSPIVKSIGRFYSKLFYHRLGLSKQSGATVAYIQDKDEDKSYIINLEELEHKFKIICSADTNVEESKASKTQGALTMMQNMSAFAQNPITGLSTINNDKFIEEMAKTVGLESIKSMTIEDQKKYIDESYEIKDYIQQKEIAAQQQMQQAQPQQGQAQPTQGEPSQEEIAMMMQQANQQQPSQPQEELNYTL